MDSIRLRFAPSPTGALHIGGIRTALYNFLLARQKKGTFVLRIEDTDQTRYVPGAEDYILEALEWCGLKPDEGPGIGGDYGPYRQSERKDLYGQYAKQLVESGHAYYAFDTAEELAEKRAAAEANGNTFKYDAKVRHQLVNSLTLSAEEVQSRLDRGDNYTIRLAVPPDEVIMIDDLVRDRVQFHTNELDDKVMLKSDGMPTYHLANIVDDHLMKITHVIRGEEWLPSTAHHVLLYRFLGWEDTMPTFAHLPLIMKPTGKGKLSKRDGAKLGIPVFPLSWDGPTPENTFKGFREFGFVPDAVNNFLAFLGWNPGTEQEIFDREELITAFSVEKIGKSGARFDYDKARWFNQQYLIRMSDSDLLPYVKPIVEAQGHQPDEAFLLTFIGLMKERVHLLPEFWEQGHYFFTDYQSLDEKMVNKKWKPEFRAAFDDLHQLLRDTESFTTESLQTAVKGFINDHGYKFGNILPILRLGLTGTTKGPDIFATMALLGRAEVDRRLQASYQHFDQLTQGA